MHAISQALTSTCATSLMYVKNSTYVPLLFMKLFVSYIGTNKIKERTKTSSLIVDCFSLTLVNLSLAWMLYFHVWHSNKGKFFVWSEYYNQFDIYQPSRVSLLKPRQNNLKDPEAYPEPCQTSKMDCFVKIVNDLNLLTFFVRHPILDVWQGLKYISVIYYLLIVWENWGH